MILTLKDGKQILKKFACARLRVLCKIMHSAVLPLYFFLQNDRGYDIINTSTKFCRYNLVVKCVLPKHNSRVRFPLPAPKKKRGKKASFFTHLQLLQLLFL